MVESIPIQDFYLYKCKTCGLKGKMPLQILMHSAHHRKQLSENNLTSLPILPCLMCDDDLYPVNYPSDKML